MNVNTSKTKVYRSFSFLLEVIIISITIVKSIIYNFYRNKLYKLFQKYSAQIKLQLPKPVEDKSR